MSRKELVSLMVIIILGMPAASGAPQNGDHLLDLKLEREAPTDRSIRAYYHSGTAAMHFADSVSLSSAMLTADTERTDEPVTVQNGCGHNLFGLSAETYYKLSAVSTVWGHAGYQRGTTLGVAFCDVTDYETVGPFVLCDDTGGDLSSQRYDFGGGWSRTFGSAWVAGVKADYGATVAHRSVDPRVKNIVSDLNVAIGGARTFGCGYMLGLNLGVRIYNQDTDVDFYNSTTHAITMVHTGLGTVSSRFRGADAQSSAHRLSAYSASLQFLPMALGDSFYGEVTAAKTSVDLVLNGYNNLKFGTTATTELSARASRLFRLNSGLTLFPTIAGYMIKRAATENLFGSAADNYTKIGERENYHHDRYGVTAELPVALTLGSRGTKMTLTPKVGYADDKESLTEPSQTLKSRYIIAGASLFAIKRLSRGWAIAALVGYESHDASSQQVRLTAMRALKTVVVSLSAEMQHSDYKSQTDVNQLTACLSLTF